MKSKSAVIILFFLFNLSCKKEVTPVIQPTTQGIDLFIKYKVDLDSFTTNALMYKTQAGYDYSITTLVYFLSEISLIRTDSSIILLKDYIYVNAVIPQENQLTLKDIPAGNYIGLRFNIGLDSLHNTPDALPATNEYINMEWPGAMGGGYHIMKLEGYFRDSSGTFGYAMHIGTNPCLVPVKIFKPITISANAITPVNLVMNINEWFRTPHQYDFNIDGNYIMGNINAMKKFSENGTDVFNF